MRLPPCSRPAMSKRSRSSPHQRPFNVFASPPARPPTLTSERAIEHAAAAFRCGQSAEAERLCKAVVAVEPKHFDALHLLGLTAATTGRHTEAVAWLERALVVDPTRVETHCNLAVVHAGAGQHAAALASYDRAIVLDAGHAHAHHERGRLLLQLQRPDAALESLERAVTLQAGNALAWSNRGVALGMLGRQEEALASYDRALTIDPDCVEAHTNRAVTLGALRRHAEALVNLRRAFATAPATEFLEGDCLHAQMRVCDWTDFAPRCAHVLARVERGERAATPFVVLSLTDAPSVQKRSAATWVAARCPSSGALSPQVRYPRHDRIRVGYFSSDFGEHPVATLSARLYEIHDRARFEIIAFSSGPSGGDTMRQRLTGAFDRFLDVRNMSDQAVAELARQLEVDIAIDLGGYTAGSRSGIFALRAAPVQAGYLGYLGTSAADYVDYLLADHVLLPEASRPHYSERIVYLPGYQVNDDTRPIADHRYSRAELGLPARGPIFCCFNNSYKFTPLVFASWMRILAAVETSVLFLYAGDAAVASNLRGEAASRGIDPDRLVFAHRLPPDQYLARYRIADLALDTFPYNAGTTASDALWAGVPLVTRAGDSMAARMAASVLHAIGLPELVTATGETYEALAIALGNDPGRLTAIRHKLEANRRVAPLFATVRFARHVEAAYTAMYARHLTGQPPIDIDVRD